MRAICVEDEQPLREQTLSLLEELPLIRSALGFSNGSDALRWLEGHRAELALLDIHLPGMNGMELAARIKTRWPSMAVIFLTEDPRFALEAFELHADGYILKPLTRERLREETEFALVRRPDPEEGRVEVITFGEFSVFTEGREIVFRQAKCRELLAYLVDRRGGSVTRAEAFAILWEDRQYDRPMQKQLDGIIRSLRTTLQEYGIEEIFELKGGQMRLVPEYVRCDLFRFCRGDPAALEEFRGEYMNGYPWAEMTAGYMLSKTQNRAPVSG